MPYIKQEDRERYDDLIDKLKRELFTAADSGHTEQCFTGHLNYIITSLIKRTYVGYIEKECNAKLCYNDYNSIIGLLECCKQEFYRKQISIYEDLKIKENGDV